MAQVFPLLIATCEGKSLRLWFFDFGALRTILECRKWGFKRWGFKEIRGYLRKKGLFPPFSGFPRCSSHPPEKGEKGRKRAKTADFGRFPGRAARHPLSPHLLHPHLRQPNKGFRPDLFKIGPFLLILETFLPGALYRELWELFFLRFWCTQNYIILPPLHLSKVFF